MYSVFLSSYRNTRESLGELEKICENNRLRLMLPQHFFLIFERSMRIKWLEPSEEDPLVYTAGNEDNHNPPHAVYHRYCTEGWFRMVRNLS